MVPSHIYNKDPYFLKDPHAPCYEVQLLLSPAISTFHKTAAACIKTKWACQKSANHNCINQSKDIQGSRRTLSSILCPF